MTPAAYKQERQRRGLTQAALARLLGVTRETVNRRESGRDRITAEAALAIRGLVKNYCQRGLESDPEFVRQQVRAAVRAGTVRRK